MKLLRIKKDAAGNLDDVKVQQADLAGRAAAADNAVNVSDTINGKTITSIFEADGITARKATSAGSAGNVASTINLKKITDIFESDGLKVKKASSATKLETARTVRTNLASTNAASFDGSSNITPGVSGTLPVANGGTGATSLDGANIVTKNTQQAITGQKKFNDYALVLNDHADFIANDIDINSNPTSEKFAYFNGKDKNGNMLGAIGFYQDPAGNTGAYLQANRGATWGGNLGIKTKAGTSDVFAYAPNPPDNSNTNQIATTYWVTKKTQGSGGGTNPNFITNPTFVINQRGKASYTNTGYSVDRWYFKTTYSNSSVSLSSESTFRPQYLIFNPGGQHVEAVTLTQYFENYLDMTAYDRDDITLSIECTTNKTRADNGDYDKYSVTAKYKYSGEVCRINIGGNTDTFVVFNRDNQKELQQIVISARNTPDTFYIRGVKLERGTVATPIYIPDKSLELLKCYRYYLKLAENAPYNGWIFGGDQARINIITPVQMRKTPTLTVEGGLGMTGIYTSGKTITITSYNFHQYRGCALVAQMFLSESAPASYPAAFRTVKPAYLDAEL